jgi:hypothetical protein
MTRLVEITAVSLVNPVPDELLGCALDMPTAGGGLSSLDAYSFDIEGWVLGRNSRVAAVEFFQGGKRIWSAQPNVRRRDVTELFPDIPDAEASGFSLSLSSLNFAPTFDLRLVALLENGTKVRFCHVSGRRAVHWPQRESQRNPLIVTTAGRSGNTLLSEVLDAHQAIIAYRPHDYFSCVIAYWLDVLRCLSEPASYLRQFHRPRFDQRDWWLGTDSALPSALRNWSPLPGAPAPKGLADRELDVELGVNGVEMAASFCKSRIDAVYSAAAVACGKQGATYFVEKYPPTVSLFSLLWDVYPSAREVILVRDFRDMACSMLEYGQRFGDESFFGNADTERIARRVKKIATSLLQAWETRSDRAHLLRYEDFVLNPIGSVEGLMAYLELEVNPQMVRRMSDIIVGTGLMGHRTTPNAKASIGRWRRDMAPELSNAVGDLLRPELASLGYDES